MRRVNHRLIRMPGLIASRGLSVRVALVLDRGAPLAFHTPLQGNAGQYDIASPHMSLPYNRHMS